MFDYKFAKTQWFCSYYTKNLRKSILIYTSLILLLVNIFVFSFLFLVLNKNQLFNETVYLYLLGITILLEGITLLFYCNKEVKNSLNKINENTLTLFFNEAGININSTAMTKSINWEIVKEVRATKHELIFYFKVNGIPSNSFFFNFFDASKDDILEALEEYTTVRRND